MNRPEVPQGGGKSGTGDRGPGTGPLTGPNAGVHCPRESCRPSRLPAPPARLLAPSAGPRRSRSRPRLPERSPAPGCAGRYLGAAGAGHGLRSPAGRSPTGSAAGRPLPRKRRDSRPAAPPPTAAPTPQARPEGAAAGPSAPASPGSQGGSWTPAQLRTGRKLGDKSFLPSSPKPTRRPCSLGCVLCRGHRKKLLTSFMESSRRLAREAFIPFFFLGK